MTDSEFRARRRTCPRCGHRVIAVGNPYYGVGLAVHSHLRICTRCDFVAFLPIASAVTEVEAGEPPQPQERRRPRGGLAGLIRFGRR
jgi:ribosomal protein S27AE